MASTPTLSLLRSAALFKALPDPALSEIASHSQTRAVEEGGFFFLQGKEARYIFVLSLGRVKLTQVSVDGQAVGMRMLAPGQMFAGGSILSPDARYPVSAEAMEDSAAWAWEAPVFRKLAEKYPALSFNLLQLMQAYIQEMQSRYRELHTERVEQRVANALVRLASQTGLKTQGAIELSLSRQDLAEMSGTTLFTTSRLLAEWARQGILETGRMQVRILKPHQLVSIAENLAGREGESANSRDRG